MTATITQKRINMSAEVYKAIENGRKESKYPSFAIEGNALVPEDKRLDFLMRNDTFFENCLTLNHAGNTRLLAEQFCYEVGLDDFLKTFHKAVTDNEFEHYERSFAKFNVQHLFKAIGYHSGSSFHLSSINSSTVGDFYTWYNLNTGEIRGYSSAYSKWVSSDEIYKDLLKLATNCPYVDLTVTLIDGNDYGESEKCSATVSIRVFNGNLSVVDTLETGFKTGKEEGFYAKDIFTSRLPSEMGVDVKTFKEITKAYKDLIKSHTQQAINIALQE